MTTSTDHLLVVGGGISGLVAALAAAQAGRRVTLVERAPQLGGLLASTSPGDGSHSFDYGTHVPAATGDAALDAVLFGWMHADDWHRLDELRAATWWNGILSPQSQFLDVRTLPAATHRAVLPGLLASTIADPNTCTSLADQVTRTYGDAMLTHVFAPILQKFYGTTADLLAPDAHHLFGLARYLCGTPEEALRLKLDPALDAKLAFHPGHDAPGTASRTAWYPRRGGVGAWVDGLHARCIEAGVQVRIGVTLGPLALDAGHVDINGEQVHFDELAWSLPAALLLRQCRHAAASTMTMPAMSAITLRHLVLDRPPVTDAFYVTCYDSAERSFRVTLYDNIQPDGGRPGRTTVEILDPDPARSAPSSDDVLAELVRMGIVTEGTGIVASFEDRLPAAFPIQTLSYRAGMRAAVDIAQADCPRVRLVGRAAGQVFFMRDVLLDAWYGPRPAMLVAR